LSALLPAAKRLVIKMDIEGAEEASLNALDVPLPDECFLFIELHRGDASLRWINSWASDHDFAFTQVRRRDDAIDGFLARPQERGGTGAQAGRRGVSAALAHAAPPQMNHRP
jgi:hypothetical protein